MEKKTLNDVTTLSSIEVHHCKMSESDNDFKVQQPFWHLAFKMCA
jgi:hypothetical protein